MGNHKSRLTVETCTQGSMDRPASPIPSPSGPGLVAGLQLQLSDSHLESNRGRQRLLGTVNTGRQEAGEKVPDQNLVPGAAKTKLIVQTQ